ncbi:hypothetical protein PV797_06830 [Clostridiaceae bacterium M8S5]|nr:hypothetical protein PV797_06830 [Clostridiaceae bacterium M8S5]
MKFVELSKNFDISKLQLKCDIEYRLNGLDVVYKDMRFVALKTIEIARKLEEDYIYFCDMNGFPVCAVRLCCVNKMFIIHNDLIFE